MKKTLTLVALACLTGCDSTPIEQDHPVITSTGVSLSVSVRTVRHDDHSFVILVTDHGAGIIHHPSCPIEKGQTK